MYNGTCYGYIIADQLNVKLGLNVN